MERYLEGEEISHEEIVERLKRGTNHGEIFPVVCGVSTRNLGTNRLLQAIVEDLPSPVEHGAFETTRSPRAVADRELFAYVFKTRADPSRGASTCCASSRARCARQPARNTRALQGADRQLIVFAGKGHDDRDDFGPGDIGGSPSSRTPARRLAGGARRADQDADRAASGSGDGVRDRAQDKGDEDKVFSSLRRLQEEDPTIDLHRDPQTGQQIVRRPLADPRRGDRRPPALALRRRGHAEAAARAYQETIRTGSKAHGRHKKQSGGRGQFGDCHIEIEPLESAPASSSSTASRAARSRTRSYRRSRRACVRRWSTACWRATPSRTCA